MLSEIRTIEGHQYAKSETKINDYMMVNKIPNRLKALIMSSLLDRYIQRGRKSLRYAFLKLYARCQTSKKQQIFHKLLGGYSCKLQKQAFLYRIKYYASKIKANNENQPQIRIHFNQVKKTTSRKVTTFTFNNNQSSKYTSLNNFILPPNQEDQICLSDEIQQKQIVKDDCKLKAPIKQKSPHSFRSNIALESLRSIIDDKVLKKKTKHSNVCFDSSVDHEEAQQHFKDKNRKNTTSVGALLKSDCKLFGNEQKIEYTRLEDLMQETLGKKNVKISDTLKLLKQISSAYLEKTLKHKVVRIKHQIFLKIKNNVWNSKNQYNNEILQLQRQLQLLNQNIEKDEEIEILTQQIENHVQDIDCIQEQFQSLSIKMKNQLILLFTKRVHKILCYNIKESFQKIKSDYYPQRKSKILQQSFGKSESIGNYSRKFEGLNSVQSLMEENQISDSNFEMEDNIVQSQIQSHYPAKKSNKTFMKTSQKKISLRLQKLSYQLEQCQQQISQINLKGQNHYENLDISLSGGDLLQEDIMKQEQSNQESSSESN